MIGAWFSWCMMLGFLESEVLSFDVLGSVWWIYGHRVGGGLGLGQWSGKGGWAGVAVLVIF